MEKAPKLDFDKSLSIVNEGIETPMSKIGYSVNYGSRQTDKQSLAEGPIVPINEMP